MSKYISKENLNHIVQEMGKKVNIIDDLTNEEIQEIIDEFNPEFVPEDEDTNVGGVPLASILPWVDDVNTVPAGFLKCDGTAVSRTTYSDLFGAIGTKYGSGDGSTTFNVPDLTDAAILNGTYDKTTFTTAGSATFTAPKDGYYKITIKGAGGGGGGGYNSSGSAFNSGGGGGGEGGTTFAYEYLSIGDTATVVIGAGGAGGASNSDGLNGGDSSVTVNSNTYTGGGGNAGGKGGISTATSGVGGAGGTGTIQGCPGGTGGDNNGSTGTAGGSGGGAGGGSGKWNYDGVAGTQGSGGAGGGSVGVGGAGGDGYVWIEYIGTASQYIIKYTPTVIDSEQSAATSASQAQAAAQAAESYAGSAGIPVGTLFPYAADTSTPPTGFLFCDGSAVSRTMYADLFSVLSTTWGAGDGNTTFNLPHSEDLVMQGASATNPIGTYKTAGLPEIEGKLGMDASNLKGSTHTSGAFHLENTPGTGSFSNTITYNANYSFLFNASESNAIYGNSNTVQPPAACVKFIIKAYDGVTPQSAGINLSQYASALNGKADRGLSNLNGTGEARFAHVVVDSYYDSTTGEWWRQYADGWIEQGGYVQYASTDRPTVNLLKPMADTKYCVMVTRLNYTTEPYYAPDVKDTKTISTFEIYNMANGTMWVAFGQGASA